MTEANENKYLFCKTDADEIAAGEDRMLYVQNLIWLLKQARLGITDGRLENDDGIELVHLFFGKHGRDRLIDVTADSYGALTKDVIDAIL